MSNFYTDNAFQPTHPTAKAATYRSRPPKLAALVLLVGTISILKSKFVRNAGAAAQSGLRRPRPIRSLATEGTMLKQLSLCAALVTLATVRDSLLGRLGSAFRYIRYSHAATLLRARRIGPSGRLISSPDGRARSKTQADANTIALSATMAEMRRWLSVLWIVTVCSSLQFDFV